MVPNRFEGRKVGVLMTDAADARLLAALVRALTKAGASWEVVAPTIAGVELSDGELVEAKHRLNGGPSVLFDAVAILVSEAGATLLAKEPAARDFVADAFAHAKFIAHVPAADPLLAKAGVAQLDEGCIALEEAADAERFVEACGALGYWSRELTVRATPTPDAPHDRA